jgi:hypothetical protein
VVSGTFNVRWRLRQTVAYGAAFYLPAQFHTAASGQQAMLRWDRFRQLLGSDTAAYSEVYEAGQLSSASSRQRSTYP